MAGLTRCGIGWGRNAEACANPSTACRCAIAAAIWICSNCGLAWAAAAAFNMEYGGGNVFVSTIVAGGPIGIGRIGPLVVVLLFNIFDEPTIESMLKPIFGFDAGIVVIDVGVGGIILFKSMLSSGSSFCTATIKKKTNPLMACEKERFLVFFVWFLLDYLLVLVLKIALLFCFFLGEICRSTKWNFGDFHCFRCRSDNLLLFCVVE